MSTQINDISNIGRLHSVYFIGIGGIGMSALARYFHERGISVSGYDKTETILTKQLEQEGIRVHYHDNIDMIDKKASIVVYTPAVPKDHKGYEYYVSHQYRILKRSEMLGLITRDTFSICVAGTHGKTTTSCMIAHVLRDSGYGCSAFLGGISANYDTNYWSHSSNVTVSEADEYDRSFLQLNPDLAVITAMDADHLDIYGTESAMQDAFVSFSNRLKNGGVLIYHKGISREHEWGGARKITYSVSDSLSQVYARNIRVSDGGYVFDAVLPDGGIDQLQLPMGGRHNVDNALAAVTVARLLKIDSEKIRKALASFKGVKRRFECVLKNNNRVMIDDYAHHPEELRSLLQGVRELYPGKKCTLVFQPHLYSRTRDLAQGFAEVMDTADEILLLPIYPARELPLPGVESEMIKNLMHNPNVRIVQKPALLDWVKLNDPEVLVMAGAGDVDQLVVPVSIEMKNKK